MDYGLLREGGLTVHWILPLYTHTRAEPLRTTSQDLHYLGLVLAALADCNLSRKVTQRGVLLTPIPMFRIKGECNLMPPRTKPNTLDILFLFLRENLIITWVSPPQVENAPLNKLVIRNNDTMDLVKIKREEKVFTDTFGNTR